MFLGCIMRNHPLTVSCLFRYVPIMTPARKLMATPTPMGTPAYVMPTEEVANTYGVAKMPVDEDLPEIKPEDQQYFSKLLEVRFARRITCTM